MSTRTPRIAFFVDRMTRGGRFGRVGPVGDADAMASAIEATLDQMQKFMTSKGDETR